MEEEQEVIVYVIKIVDLPGNEEIYYCRSMVELRHNLVPRLLTCTPCISFSNLDGTVIDDNNWLQHVDENNMTTLRVINNISVAEEMKTWTKDEWEIALEKYITVHDRGILDALYWYCTPEIKIELKELSMEFAAEHGCTNIVRELITLNEISEKCIQDTFLISCSVNHTDIVQLLLTYANGMEMEKCNRGLYIACSKGFQAMVKLLIDHGVDINGKGRGALYVACNKGYESIVQILLEHGVKITGEIGGDALYVSSMYGYTKIVELLLQHDAEVYGEKGGRSLLKACKKGYKEIVILLLQYGVDVQGEWGSRSLRGAQQNERDDIISILLEYGAVWKDDMAESCQDSPTFRYTCS